MSDKLQKTILTTVKSLKKLLGVLWFLVKQETCFTSLNSGLRVFFFTEVLLLDFFPISGCKMLKEKEKREKKDDVHLLGLFRSFQPQDNT